MAMKTGLAKAGQIYGGRSERAGELRAEGKKIIGYLCLYPAIEMLTALDLVPYRLFAEMKEPITKADNYLPTIVCPFLRGLLDLGVKGKYNFLDGVVMAHSCDVGAQMLGLWNNFVKTPYPILSILLTLCIPMLSSRSRVSWRPFEKVWNHSQGSS